MIPTLIILMLRRYRTNHPASFALMQAMIITLARFLFCLLLALTLGIQAFGQEKTLPYTIMKGSSEVGLLKVKEVISGKKISLRMESNIQAKMVFSFSASGFEESVYDQGVLQYSHIYQKLNGKERVNRKIRLNGASYVVSDKGQSDTFQSNGILYNMVCLYAHEPTWTNKIYVDRFHEYVAIEKLGEHKYRIVFPDGNSNTYTYVNGQCSRIEVSHPLFSVTMNLKQ
jgi:hypothetical protein